LRVMEASGEALAQRDSLMVEVLWHTGIRISELVDLNVSDVDLGKGLMRTRSKGGREQVRYLKRSLRAGLRSHLRDISPDAPVFASTTGKRLTTRHIARRLRMWLAKAGIAVSA